MAHPPDRTRSGGSGPSRRVDSGPPARPRVRMSWNAGKAGRLLVEEDVGFGGRRDPPPECLSAVDSAYLESRASLTLFSREGPFRAAGGRWRSEGTTPPGGAERSFWWGSKGSVCPVCSSLWPIPEVAVRTLRHFIETHRAGPTVRMGGRCTCYPPWLADQMTDDRTKERALRSRPRSWFAVPLRSRYQADHP